MKKKPSIQTLSTIIAVLISVFIGFVINKYRILDFELVTIVFALSIIPGFAFFFGLLSNVILYFLSKKSKDPVEFSYASAFLDKGEFSATFPIVLLICLVGCIWMNADQVKEIDTLHEEISQIEYEKESIENDLDEYKVDERLLDDYRSECNRMRERLEYIDEECVVYERGTCVMCGESAPYGCYGLDDENICPDCVSKMLHDYDVWDAVINYRER